MEQHDYLMCGYPKEVKYYMCSDRQTFPTYEQALDHEKYLQRQNRESQANNVYTHTGPTPEIYY